MPERACIDRQSFCCRGAACLGAGQIAELEKASHDSSAALAAAHVAAQQQADAAHARMSELTAALAAARADGEAAAQAAAGAADEARGAAAALAEQVCVLDAWLVLCKHWRKSGTQTCPSPTTQ